MEDKVFKEDAKQIVDMAFNGLRIGRRRGLGSAKLSNHD